MQRAGNQPVRVLQAGRPSIIISFYKNEQMLWNLVGWDQLCYERNLSPNHVKFYLKNERVAMEWVTCLLAGTCWGGRQQWGGALLIIWRIVASAGFCGHLLSYARSLCQEILKADKCSLFWKWWLQRKKGPAYSSLERLGTPEPRVFEANCSTSAFLTERNTWKNPRVKAFR